MYSAHLSMFAVGLSPNAYPCPTCLSSWPATSGTRHRGLGGLGQMTPDEDECVALPDPSTLCVLPWDPRFAHMAADLYFGGTEPFALCPRSVLKRQVEQAEAAGFAMQLGVETELYFYRPGVTPTAPPPGPRAGLPAAVRTHRPVATNPRLRRRGHHGHDGRARPDGKGHERMWVRGVQLRRRGWRRAGRVRLRATRRRCRWRTGSSFSG